MARFSRRLLAALGLLLVLAVPAQAAKFALVVGNAAYASFGTLANTQHDADAFAGFLSAAGFSVSAVSDTSGAQLAATVQGFAAGLKAGDVAVFYFAGHSVLAAGRDYFVGVDAKPAADADLPSQGIAVDQVVGEIGAHAGFTMALIDAARGERLVGAAAGPQPSTASLGRTRW